MSDVSESLRSLTKNERCERIAQVAHQKWVIRSWLLTKNERSARFFERVAHWLIFSQKTSDSLRKPMREFPALVLTINEKNFFSNNKITNDMILDIDKYIFLNMNIQKLTWGVRPVGSLSKTIAGWWCPAADWGLSQRRQASPPPCRK